MLKAAKCYEILLAVLFRAHQYRREKKMPFVKANVDSLEGQPKVGGGQCVRLVQHYSAGIGTASQWREGAVVMGNTALAKGTAIATFVNGVYPNQASGNHAAYYISQDAGGITVMDQWAGPGKPTISSRYIRSKGKDKSGNFVSPSDNADAFSVIEH